MTGFWVRAAMVAAMVGTVAACSAAEPTPASPAGSTTVRPPTSASATTSTAPAKPRTITECLDGYCRISVIPGDRVRLDGVMGLGALSLPFISRSKIRMRVELSGGVGFATIPNPLREGLPAGEGRRIKVVAIDGSRAVIEIND
jgi:hypothetical protein